MAERGLDFVLRDDADNTSRCSFPVIRIQAAQVSPRVCKSNPTQSTLDGRDGSWD